MTRIRSAFLAAAAIAVAWSGPVWAQQAPAAPPAANAPAAAAPATVAPLPVGPVPSVAAPEPPASQLAAARDLVLASGISRSFYPMVPQLRGQIIPMLTRTRPDLTKDLTEVVAQLGPEFDKQTDDMITIAAHIYARRMSEDELKQAAAFFNSPVGVKYVAIQPDMLDELVVAMQSWTQKVSNFMMLRVRQEMLKRGKDF